jgi:hypothetical protein
MKSHIKMLILILLTACKNHIQVSEKFNNQKSFPGVPFSKVKLLSLNDSLRSRVDKIYFDSGIREKFMIPSNEYSGITFIDSNFKPIHSLYRETELDSAEIMSLLELVKPINDTTCCTDFACFRVFRDAIVFYSLESKPLACIHVCFDCDTPMFNPSDPKLENILAHPERFEGIRKIFEKKKFPIK